MTLYSVKVQSQIAVYMDFKYFDNIQCANYQDMKRSLETYIVQEWGSYTIYPLFIFTNPNYYNKRIAICGHIISS